jgi:hypothetical protein
MGLHRTLGAAIYGVLRTVDRVQTVLRLQKPKRRLTSRERSLLRPVFQNAIDYDALRVVEGRAGLLTPTGRALTMGHTIYLPTPSDRTLVHECVHVWQFEADGFRYIGNSALHQLAGFLSRRYRPYHWRPSLDAGRPWHGLKSAEAQAQFIEDLYAHGFFDTADAGPYTPQAKAAWAHLTGDGPDFVA